MGAARLIGKTKDQVIARYGAPMRSGKCMWVGPEAGLSEEERMRILDETIDTELEYPAFVVCVNVRGVVIAVRDK